MEVYVDILRVELSGLVEWVGVLSEWFSMKVVGGTGAQDFRFGL
jgi:hypothetical protein